jgi:hypothetical protein
MTIITVGIDLAKNVFAVHGVNVRSLPVMMKQPNACVLLPESGSSPPMRSVPVWAMPMISRMAGSLPHGSVLCSDFFRF